MMRFAAPAPLLCALALLGGCGMGAPPDPVADGRLLAHADGVWPTPGARSALQGVSPAGAPAPYAGGTVVAPVGILPRAVAPGQPGLASGVDAPPAVAPGPSMAGPRFGDVAGAGPVIDVRERRYVNGATQDVVYRAPAAASGENRLAVAVMETSRTGGEGDALKLSAPSLADIEGEIGTAFPAGSMTISEEVAENASGVFGYAQGRVAGDACIYAWQFIAPTARRSLLDDFAGLEGYDVSVRMRFCGGRSPSRLVALASSLRLHLERLRGRQGLFAPAPALTPAVLALPGPVVAEPLGTTVPTLPPTGAAGLGAEPAATLRGSLSGDDPAPASFADEPAHPRRRGPAPGEAWTGDRRPTPGNRRARATLRPRGSRDGDAEPRSGAVPTFHDLRVRTVRPAGRPFIPLPDRIAPVPGAAPPAAPAASDPRASAAIEGLPVPR